MGFRQALAGRNRGIEARALEKSAKRKSLFSSIGKTVGGIAATAITGGAAAPWAAGLMAGAGSFVGGAVGSGVGGEVQGGSFFREEAADLNKDLGAFGEENITSALKSGLTAGIGQKLKLMKGAKAAKLADPKMTDEAFKALSKGKGLDFSESFVGRGLEKSKTKLFDAYTDIRTGSSTGFTGTRGTAIKAPVQSIKDINPDYFEQLHAGTAFTDKLTLEGPLFGDPDAKPLNLWSKFKKDQDISSELMNFKLPFYRDWNLSGLGSVVGGGK